MIKKALLFTCVLFLLFQSCEENNDEVKSASLTLLFKHLIDNQEIQFDKLIYTNEAGNEYEISEIQWFVSDVILVNDNNEEMLLNEGGFAHYVDTDISETSEWDLPDEIQPGNYKAIKMTFGIKGEKNIPNSFPNPPESAMIWPYHMGGDNGGYHYMKLNGFWINTMDERTPFNFHMGVGQEYDKGGNIVGDVQNWFEAELPNSSFTVNPGEKQNIILKMNVENWFKDPNVYDHNIFGGKIMNNQEAMGQISENGYNVFSVEMDETESEGNNL